MDSASSPPEIGKIGVGPRWRTSSPATKVATGKLPTDASIRSPQTRPSMSGGAQRWISVTDTTLSKPMPRPNTAMPAVRPGSPPMNGAAAIAAAATTYAAAISTAGRNRSPTRPTMSAPRMLATATQVSTAPYPSAPKRACASAGSATSVVPTSAKLALSTTTRTIWSTRDCRSSPQTLPAPESPAAPAGSATASAAGAAAPSATVAEAEMNPSVTAETRYDPASAANAVDGPVTATR